MTATALPSSSHLNASLATYATKTQPNSLVYQKRPYLLYLEFAEGWVSGVAQLVSISMNSFLLYCLLWAKHRVKLQDGLSSTMYVYLVSQVVCSTAGLPYTAYIIGWWTPRGNNYSAYPLFWSGVVMGTYMSTACIPVFFVTLDRWLAIKFPVRAKISNLPEKVGWLSAGTLVAAIVFQLLQATREMPLPEGTGCRTFICFFRVTKGFPMLVPKTTFEVLNFLFSFALFHALGRLSGEAAKQIKNRLAKYLMAFEITFGVVPVGVTTLFNAIVGESSSNYFGIVPIMFACIDAAACSIYYCMALLKWRREQPPSTTAAVRLTAQHTTPAHSHIATSTTPTANGTATSAVMRNGLRLSQVGPMPSAGSLCRVAGSCSPEVKSSRRASARYQLG